MLFARWITLNSLQHVLFSLEADDQALVSRYKETRRKHPLATQERTITGIQKEREMLSDIRHDHK